MRGFARTEFEFLSRIGTALERLWQTGQMADFSLMLVLLVLLFGSYVQAVAGFALGMIAVAVIGGLRLLDIPTLAAIVSFLSLLNAGGVTTRTLCNWLTFMKKKLARSHKSYIPKLC